MLRVGRSRSKHKDLPLGVYPVKGRYYARPVNEEMRRVFEIRFPGKRSAPLGADKAEMRKEWVKLFVTDQPEETGGAGTLGELLDRFERDVIAFLGPKEKREATRYVKNLRKEFGARRYAKSEAEAASGAFLRTMEVQRYLDTAQGRPVAANREIRCLARIFRLARTRWGYTEYNPCLQVEYNTESPRSAYHTDEAFMKMYEGAAPVLQCMMDLAQMHGARRGMLMKATLACLTNDGVLLPLNKRKKTEVQRFQLIEWNDDLRAVIARALELRKEARGAQLRALRKATGDAEAALEIADAPSAPLFLTRAGRAFNENAFNVMWRRARKKAGITERGEFTFHDIKAKSVSDSPDIIDGMKRGGHLDLKTTQRVYVRKPTRVIPLPRVSGKGG